MNRHFIVGPGDGTTVGDVLSRLGETAGAVTSGRVFVDRRRVLDAKETLREGEELVVHAPLAPPAAIQLLSEWRGLHAVWKPAGIPTEPDRQGRTSLVQLAADQLRVPASALHAATRLDAPVSGVVVVAQGSEAARLVATLKDGGNLQRRYLGVTSRALDPTSGVWSTPIGRSRGRAAPFGQDAREARTRYRFTARTPLAALLVAEPVTGRTHQIRIHAAVAGAALLGDPAHGGARRVTRADGRVVTVPRVALHAARVTVVKGGRVEWTVVAPLATDLMTLWVDLDGAPAAFDDALDLPNLDTQ